jgi:hypothetical protein
LLLYAAMMARHLAVGAMALMIALMFADSARGQCAATVSSCVQCHETEGRFKVRENGTAWHGDHAIGDFCAGCHGGNPEAAGQADAHQGVGQPLADPGRSCAPCHEGYAALAERYQRAATARRNAHDDSSGDAGDNARAHGPRPGAERPAPGVAREHDGAATALVLGLLGVACATVVTVERLRQNHSAPR